MNKNSTKNHINNILGKKMKLSDSKWLPQSQNASYNIYSESWATCIAVDIVKYKDNVLGKYKKWATINVLQSFTSTIIKIGKENKRFVSAYTNGDQVIVCFASPYKSDLESIYDTAIEINSAINYLMPKIMLSNLYKHPFSAGIGIWMSDGNSIVKYGEKGSSEESFTTLIGDSINFATELSDIANRNGKPSILMNKLFFTNLKDSGTSNNMSWIRFQPNFNIDGKSIYGSNVKYTIYNK